MEKLFLVITLLLLVSKTFGANFCTPLDSPGPEQTITRIESGDVDDLLWQLRTASPDTTLSLADGVYSLASDQSLEVNVPRITIRSASGNRESVIIERGYNNISVNADNFTVANLTLRTPRFHNIQVRGESGVRYTKAYNVHLLDAGQQFVKVSTGDGTLGQFADNGLVACSLIEYTTYSSGTDITPPTYTDGVDILAGKDWVIRDNIFRRIRSKAGPAGPAILVWKNAMNTVVQRNLIIDSWRGITLGLDKPDTLSRGGSQVFYDHQNGLVENNVILALHESADAAIENNYAFNSQVFHNTVYYNETIKHAVDWSIEYRFLPTTAIIKNNLTNFPIIKRYPFPTRDAILAGNVTDAKVDWFENILADDFHLTRNVPAIDNSISITENSEDIDGNARPIGKASDAGADECECPGLQ